MRLSVLVELRGTVLRPRPRSRISSERASTFWVRMNNSMCHNVSNVASKFEKLHISGLSHSPYSPDISQCDFWSFRMLKRILKDRRFRSHQSIFDNWVRRLPSVIENSREYTLQFKRNQFKLLSDCGDIRGRRFSLHFVIHTAKCWILEWTR
jgi:hypothetical protein